MIVKKYTLHYEGYWNSGAFCDIEVHKEGEKTIIMATDCSEVHKNTSLTNRVERIMFLAWEREGKPENVQFIERYTGHYPEADEVTFQFWPDTRACFCGGKVVGDEFFTPHWKRIEEPKFEKV